jgi:hypothetical protein
MYIQCTNGTPIVGILNHLPPLPFFIDYQDTTAPITPQDELAIGQALLLCDHVRHIDLRLLPLTLHTFLLLMNEPFSMLEYLSLSYQNMGYPNFVLPKTFLAPNLHHLSLVVIDIPKRLQFLTSTVSLITLVLTDIQIPGSFLPRLLAARLQSLPQLEIFSIGFADPIPRPCAQRELLSKLGATVTLPNLKHLTYQGVSAYLECLVAQISTPLLQRLEITLFNQIAFELPHLSHFTNIIEGLKLPIAKVSFRHNTVSVITDHHKLQQYDGGISLHVICRQMDWQIDCAVQICNGLMHMLNGVENLRLIFYEEMMPTKWEDGKIDGTTWHDLLRVFVGVKELHICTALSQELSRALQANVGSNLGFLHSLQEIVSEFEGSDAENLFSSFIRACQIVGNPVCYLQCPLKARAQWACASSDSLPSPSLILMLNITVTVQILCHWRTLMSCHFPRVTFLVLSTRQACGGKQKQRMAFVVVCRTFSLILMHVCSDHHVVIPSNIKTESSSVTVSGNDFIRYMLQLVGHSVQCEWGWGNPECQQRIAEVCPYIGGCTTERIEYHKGIVGGAVQAQSMTTVIEWKAVFTHGSRRWHLLRCSMSRCDRRGNSK